MNLPIMHMSREESAQYAPFRAPPIPSSLARGRYVQPSDLEEACSHIRRELSRTLSRPNGITISREQAEALLNAVEAK